MAGREKKGIDTKLIVLVAAVAVLIFAGFAYFNQGTGAPKEPAPQKNTDPLQAPAARLLLSAFDQGAKLQEYEIAYTVTENGAKTEYGLVNAGSASFVNVTGAFGNLQGYFNGENSTDVTCLTYAGETRCAQSGNNSDAASVAASLKILLPDKKTFLSQKSQITKLVSVGAITLAPEVAVEKVGAFDTKKISYTLDYKKLTVEQLLSVGISPNDPSLTAITDQKVEYWIDTATGFIVKSKATYRETLAPNTYETEYTKIKLAGAVAPAKPQGLIETPAFVSFYKRAEQDYQAKVSCLSLPASDRVMCLKSLAAEKRNWDICKLIENKADYEACTLIVAQNTNNKVLCEKLEYYADDCYIAVAGQTGNFELCKSLKNTSLLGNCTSAATGGAKKAADTQEALRKALDYRDCAADSDCRTFGAAKQYCAPKNTTKQFANESSPVFACYASLPCACNEGYCGFRKNESFYQCVSDVENFELEKYIDSLSNKSNSTGR